MPALSTVEMPALSTVEMPALSEAEMEENNPDPNPTPPTPLVIPDSIGNPSQINSKSTKKISLKLMTGIIFLLFLVGSAAGFYVYKQNKKSVAKPTPVVQKQNPLPTVASAKAGTPDQTVNWKTYTNSDNLFSFSYPLDFSLSKPSNSSIILRKHEDLDRYNSANTSIEINFEKLDSNETLDQWLDKRYSREAGSFNENPNKTSEKITFKGVSAVKVQFGKQNGSSIDKGIAFIYKQKGFDIQIAGLAKYLDDYDQILSTFKFTNSTNSYNNGKFSFDLPPEYAISQQNNNEVDFKLSSGFGLTTLKWQNTPFPEPTPQPDSELDTGTKVVKTPMVLDGKNVFKYAVSNTQRENVTNEIVYFYTSGVYYELRTLDDGGGITIDKFLNSFKFIQPTSTPRSE